MQIKILFVMFIFILVPWDKNHSKEAASKYFVYLTARQYLHVNMRFYDTKKPSQN
jgi:hypothetical protein